MSSLLKKIIELEDGNHGSEEIEKLLTGTTDEAVSALAAVTVVL
jgi:hypothetical protein